MSVLSVVCHGHNAQLNDSPSSGAICATSESALLGSQNAVVARANISLYFTEEWRAEKGASM